MRSSLSDRLQSAGTVARRLRLPATGLECVTMAATRGRWAGLVALALIAGGLAGCSTWSGVLQPDVPKNAPSVYVLPDSEDQAGVAGSPQTPQKPDPEDLLEAGDLLDIVVRRGAGEEKYQSIVRASGNISVAFQEINVKGLTEEEAEQRINQVLSRVIRNPSTQLRVTQKATGRPKSFYMIGEVKNAGKYPLTRRMTLLQAIAVGNGYTDVAMTERVVLITKREGRKPLIRIVNMKTALISADQAPDIPLSENDIIFVPRSEAGDFYNYYQKVANPAVQMVLGIVNGVFIGKALDAAWRVPVDQTTQTAIPVCWVAGVLYGDHAWQTHLLRWYIVGPFSDHWAGRTFADLYRTYGRQAARLLERHPRLQALVRPLFDRLLKEAILAAETGTPDLSSRSPRSAAARHGL